MPSAAEWLAERPVQLRGSRIARAVLRLAGWRLVFDGLPARQGVLVLYPHTTNWDFIWAMLAKSAIGMKASFWAKEPLFKVPLFGRWVRWLGGVPVERRSPRGAVGAMVEHIRAKAARDEFFWLALAPEGTRKRTEGWRSGFYQVASQAAVPLALAFIDYAERRLGVVAFLRLSGDPQADMATIVQGFAAAAGELPQGASPIRLLS